MISDAIGLLLILFTKHFIFDFLTQGEYQWRNKGTFGHPGGLVHSAVHAWFTSIVVYFVFGVDSWLATLILIGEFVVHYFTDYAKMNINRIKGWKADTHPQFWYLTGLDQWIHALTYLGIAAIVFR